MEQKRLLCFGDSNTYGWIGSLTAPTRRYPSSVRWTGRLAAGLGDGWDVLEEGLGGRTLQDRRTEGSGIPLPGAGLSAADYLPSCLLSHLPLDAVIIMLGSNDMKSVLGRSETDIAGAMAALVDMTHTLPWETPRKGEAAGHKRRMTPSVFPRRLSLLRRRLTPCRSLR